MKQLKYTFAAVSAFLMTAGISAYAQNQSPSPSASPSPSVEPSESPGPCASDVQQFCSDVTPGRGRILACLKAHDDKISQGCRQSVETKIKEILDLLMACKCDMERFCKDQRNGGDRNQMMSCLKGHMSELSSSCKKEMQEMKD